MVNIVWALLQAAEHMSWALFASVQMDMVVEAVEAAVDAVKTYFYDRHVCCKKPWVCP